MPSSGSLIISKQYTQWNSGILNMAVVRIIGPWVLSPKTIDFQKNFKGIFLKSDILDLSFSNQICYWY